MKALRELSASYNGATPTQLAIAWLLRHPSQIIPIVGSTNPDHIKEAVAATTMELSRADWYRLWIAARGEAVP
jgi:predicted oxidoreductase